MVLVRPRINHIGWFSFGHAADLIEAGYQATREALVGWERVLEEPGGVFPRRTMRISVDRERCTGCGLCVALAPNLMALDGERKAYALTHEVSWAPADGDFVRHCPTEAIRADRVDADRHPAPPAVLPGELASDAA